MMDYSTDDLKIALLDLLDMQGALAGDSHELSGWGLSDERRQELWELGQTLLTEREELGWM